MPADCTLVWHKWPPEEIPLSTRSRQAVQEVKIAWTLETPYGRRGPSEITLSARWADPDTIPDLGDLVEINFWYGGPRPVNLAARVTSLSIDTPPAGMPTLHLTCTDYLGYLQSIRIGDQPWPEEPVPARLGRISRAIRDTPLPAVGGYVGEVHLVCAARDADRQPPLDLIAKTLPPDYILVAAADQVIAEKSSPRFIRWPPASTPRTTFAWVDGGNWREIRLDSDQIEHPKSQSLDKRDRLGEVRFVGPTPAGSVNETREIRYGWVPRSDLTTGTRRYETDWLMTDGLEDTLVWEPVKVWAQTLVNTARQARPRLAPQRLILSRIDPVTVAGNLLSPQSWGNQILNVEGRGLSIVGQEITYQSGHLGIVVQAGPATTTTGARLKWADIGPSDINHQRKWERLPAGAFDWASISITGTD